MLNALTARGKVILSLIVFLVLLGVCTAGYFVWQKHVDTEAKLQQAIVLTEKQAQDKNVLQNKLNLSNQNAEMLANFINKAQAGQVQPINHFTVQAPTVQVAAEDVAKRINEKDPTLPPAALEKTDNTIVSTRPLTDKEKEEAKKANEANKGTDKPLVNEEFGVGVYKNNNYRNWEWSTGYGQHGGDRYVPVELRRNFSKNVAISYEHHFLGKEKGYEVTYTRKTDRLFFIF